MVIIVAKMRYFVTRLKEEVKTNPQDTALVFSPEEQVKSYLLTVLWLKINL